MKRIEFFIAPDGENILAQDGEEMKIIDENSEHISEILSIIKRDYPKAYDSLDSIYGGSAHFRFLMVRRFIKCNFGVLDNKVDILNNEFTVEHVPCPMRGECKYERVICLPEFCTELTARELEVLHLIADGLADTNIADKLFISIFTVDNHRKSIYKKLGLHSRAELIIYAKKLK